MPAKQGYYTGRRRFPRMKSEYRIKLPPIIKRPVRFQVRSLIKKEFLRQSPWWFIMHRRGVQGRGEVGPDQLEARAVPKSLVRGTLPERILYAALVTYLHFIPGIDFNFQSSLQGGRVQFGGIVADFEFPNLRLVIQVQGPTHTEFIRIKKDQEQRLALEEMGYTVVEVTDELIYNEIRLDDWLRRTFGWIASGGSGGYEVDIDDSNSNTITQYEIELWARIWFLLVTYVEPKLEDYIRANFAGTNT